MNFRRILLATALAFATPTALHAATCPQAIAPATAAVTTELSESTLADQAAYAARESASRDLEQFAGGYGVVYVLLVVLLVVILLIILL